MDDLLARLWQGCPDRWCLVCYGREGRGGLMRRLYGRRRWLRG